ncbi:MAG: pseudaminic acid cytidylyltransferase [Lachnospiraceae bacterium]|nr:pseudaminic acid cytidylyltransferase [Lachnospiraceae bacterium]
MKTLAIITARGGSKRIPRKNIREFCGKPILAYSVEAALGSSSFDTVMISTDDEEIAAIGKKFGAEVPFFRSAETSSDHATTSDVLTEVLAEYEKRGQNFEIACCIYPTAPFITAQRLREAVAALRDSDADTLLPVVSFSYPPQRALVIRDGCLVFKHPEHLTTRSQDLEKHYHDAGQFYTFRTAAFKKNGNIMQGKILPLVLDELEVQDIDTEDDWRLAEMKYALLHGENEDGSLPAPRIVNIPAEEKKELLRRGVLHNGNDQT